MAAAAGWTAVVSDQPTDPPGATGPVAHRFADVRWVAETGSTNADVMALAREGEPEGIVVVADHQIAGRGRRGRRWEAPPGASLMATVLLRPRAVDLGATTMALAVAAAEAIEQVTGVTAGLKWPNDLVWPAEGTGADRKLAGILAEADWPVGSAISDGWSPPEPTQRLAVAAGIGLNVAWGRAMPEDLSATAVALDEIVAPAAPPERAVLLGAILGSLERWYGLLAGDGGPEDPGAGRSGRSGRSQVMAAWRDRSATLGRRVRVDLGSEDVEGTAVDITDEGHLVVRSVDGSERILAVGDVVHLRPAVG